MTCILLVVGHATSQHHQKASTLKSCFNIFYRQLLIIPHHTSLNFFVALLQIHVWTILFLMLVCWFLEPYCVCWLFFYGGIVGWIVQVSYNFHLMYLNSKPSSTLVYAFTILPLGFVFSHYALVCWSSLGYLVYSFWITNTPLGGCDVVFWALWLWWDAFLKLCLKVDRKLIYRKKERDGGFCLYGVEMDVFVYMECILYYIYHIWNNKLLYLFFC